MMDDFFTLFGDWEGRFSRITRKSYRLGILQGFAEKLRVTERPIETHGLDANIISKALVAFHDDRDLESYLSRVYPTLRSRRAAAQRIDSIAYAAGKSLGNKITLSKPVAGTSENQGRMLPGK